MKLAFNARPPFSFWKIGQAEGVLKLPFIEDTAVSKEILPCLFLTLMIQLVGKVIIPLQENYPNTT